MKLKNQVDSTIEQEWEKWKECLGGKDRNSICNQAFMMVWDQGIYRLILEGRQLTIDKNPNQPRINSPLHSFIDRNYFQTQVTAIRKIIDNSSPISGDKGIYSLPALIKDIRKFCNELNRQKYFELRQIPYDIEIMKKIQDDYFREQAVLTKGFFLFQEKNLQPRLLRHIKPLIKLVIKLL